MDRVFTFLIEHIDKIGVAALVLILLFNGGRGGWWMYRRDHDEIVAAWAARVASVEKECDRWREVALTGEQLTHRAIGTAQTAVALVQDGTAAAEPGGGRPQCP